MAPYGLASDVPAVWTDSANESYWRAQSLVADAEVNTPSEASFGFSRASLIWTRSTPTGTREDAAITHLDWAHIDVGVCVPLSSVEMGEVETAVGAFMTSAIATFDDQFTLDRITWFTYQPISPRPGPAVRDTDVNYVGGGSSGRMPDQMAVSTTYRTLSRRHWGRSYWPMNTYGNVDATYGRLTDARCTSIGGWLETLLLTDGAGNGIHPVVASIRYHGVMNIRELVVDNIYDVVRRRRPKQASFRSTNSR